MVNEGRKNQIYMKIIYVYFSSSKISRTFAAK
jgi:hypothetical protein